MPQNNRWLAILAVSALLPILRNGLAGEQVDYGTNEFSANDTKAAYESRKSNLPAWSIETTDDFISLDSPSSSLPKTSRVSASKKQAIDSVHKNSAPKAISRGSRKITDADPTEQSSGVDDQRFSFSAKRSTIQQNDPWKKEDSSGGSNELEMVVEATKRSSMEIFEVSETYSEEISGEPGLSGWISRVAIKDSSGRPNDVIPRNLRGRKTGTPNRSSWKPKVHPYYGHVQGTSRGDDNASTAGQEADDAETPGSQANRLILDWRRFDSMNDRDALVERRGDIGFSTSSAKRVAEKRSPRADVLVNRFTERGSMDFGATDASLHANGPRNDISPLFGTIKPFNLQGSRYKRFVKNLGVKGELEEANTETLPFDFTSDGGEEEKRGNVEDLGSYKSMEAQLTDVPPEQRSTVNKDEQRDNGISFTTISVLDSVSIQSTGDPKESAENTSVFEDEGSSKFNDTEDVIIHSADVSLPEEGIYFMNHRVNNSGEPLMESKRRQDDKDNKEDEGSGLTSVTKEPVEGLADSPDGSAGAPRNSTYPRSNMDSLKAERSLGWKSNGLLSRYGDKNARDPSRNSKVRSSAEETGVEKNSDAGRQHEQSIAPRLREVSEEAGEPSISLGKTSNQTTNHTKFDEKLNDPELIVFKGVSGSMAKDLLNQNRQRPRSDEIEDNEPPSRTKGEQVGNGNRVNPEQRETKITDESAYRLSNNASPMTESYVSRHRQEKRSQSSRLEHPVVISDNETVTFGIDSMTPGGYVSTTEVSPVRMTEFLTTLVTTGLDHVTDDPGGTFSTEVVIGSTDSRVQRIDANPSIVASTDDRSNGTAGSLGNDYLHVNVENSAKDNSSLELEPLDQWPVKHSAVVEGDLVLGGLMMVHEREDTITCGPVMPQGGVQALEAMLYTLDRLNDREIVPGVKIGAHILDDCDKDTYGLEMAVDFIKGTYGTYVCTSVCRLTAGN